MVGRKNSLLVTKRSLRNADMGSGKRPRRIVQPKLLDDTVGMSRQEEQELNKALYASLNDSRRSKSLPTLSSFDIQSGVAYYSGMSSNSNDGTNGNSSSSGSSGRNCSSTNTPSLRGSSGSAMTKTSPSKQGVMSLGKRRAARTGNPPPKRFFRRSDSSVHRPKVSALNSSAKRTSLQNLIMDETSQDSTQSSSSSVNGSKKKIHAQRKFAQGCSLPGTPTSAPAKTSTPPIKLLSHAPKTEDFLAFLCLRGSSVLPPHLDFFNFSREELPPRSESSKSDVCTSRGKKTREVIPDENSSTSSGANEEVAEAVVATPSVASKNGGGSVGQSRRSAARASAGTPETARGIVSLRQGLQRKVSSSSSSSSSSPHLCASSPAPPHPPPPPATSRNARLDMGHATTAAVTSTNTTTTTSNNNTTPPSLYKPKFYFIPEKASPSEASGILPGEFTPPSRGQHMSKHSPLIYRPFPSELGEQGCSSSSSTPRKTHHHQHQHHHHGGCSSSSSSSSPSSVCSSPSGASKRKQQTPSSLSSSSASSAFFSGRTGCQVTTNCWPVFSPAPPCFAVQTHHLRLAHPQQQQTVISSSSSSSSSSAPFASTSSSSSFSSSSSPSPPLSSPSSPSHGSESSFFPSSSPPSSRSLLSVPDASSPSSPNHPSSPSSSVSCHHIHADTTDCNCCHESHHFHSSCLCSDGEVAAEDCGHCTSQDSCGETSSKSSSRHACYAHHFGFGHSDPTVPRSHTLIPSQSSLNSLFSNSADSRFRRDKDRLVHFPVPSVESDHNVESLSTPQPANPRHIQNTSRLTSLTSSLSSPPCSSSCSLPLPSALHARNRHVHSMHAECLCWKRDASHPPPNRMTNPNNTNQLCFCNPHIFHSASRGESVRQSANLDVVGRDFSCQSSHGRDHSLWVCDGFDGNDRPCLKASESCSQELRNEGNVSRSCLEPLAGVASNEAEGGRENLLQTEALSCPEALTRCRLFEKCRQANKGKGQLRGTDRKSTGQTEECRHCSCKSNTREIIPKLRIKLLKGNKAVIKKSRKGKQCKNHFKPNDFQKEFLRMLEANNKATAEAAAQEASQNTGNPISGHPAESCHAPSSSDTYSNEDQNTTFNSRRYHNPLETDAAIRRKRFASQKKLDARQAAHGFSYSSSDQTCMTAYQHHENALSLTQRVLRLRELAFSRKGKLTAFNPVLESENEISTAYDSDTTFAESGSFERSIDCDTAVASNQNQFDEEDHMQNFHILGTESDTDATARTSVSANDRREKSALCPFRTKGTSKSSQCKTSTAQKNLETDITSNKSHENLGQPAIPFSSKTSATKNCGKSTFAKAVTSESMESCFFSQLSQRRENDEAEKRAGPRKSVDIVKGYNKESRIVVPENSETASSGKKAKSITPSSSEAEKDTLLSKKYSEDTGDTRQEAENNQNRTAFKSSKEKSGCSCSKSEPKSVNHTDHSCVNKLDIKVSNEESQQSGGQTSHAQTVSVISSMCHGRGNSAGAQGATGNFLCGAPASSALTINFTIPKDFSSHASSESESGYVPSKEMRNRGDKSSTASGDIPKQLVDACSSTDEEKSQSGGESSVNSHQPISEESQKSSLTPHQEIESDCHSPNSKSYTEISEVSNSPICIEGSDQESPSSVESLIGPYKLTDSCTQTELGEKEDTALEHVKISTEFKSDCLKSCPDIPLRDICATKMEQMVWKMASKENKSSFVKVFDEKNSCMWPIPLSQKDNTIIIDDDDDDNIEIIENEKKVTIKEDHNVTFSLSSEEDYAEDVCVLDLSIHGTARNRSALEKASVQNSQRQAVSSAEDRKPLKPQDSLAPLTQTSIVKVVPTQLGAKGSISHVLPSNDHIVSSTGNSNLSSVYPVLLTSVANNLCLTNINNDSSQPSESFESHRGSRSNNSQTAPRCAASSTDSKPKSKEVLKILAKSRDVSSSSVDEKTFQGKNRFLDVLETRHEDPSAHVSNSAAEKERTESTTLDDITLHSFGSLCTGQGYTFVHGEPRECDILNISKNQSHSRANLKKPGAPTSDAVSVLQNCFDNKKRSPSHLNLSTSVASHTNNYNSNSSNSYTVYDEHQLSGSSHGNDNESARGKGSLNAAPAEQSGTKMTRNAKSMPKGHSQDFNMKSHSNTKRSAGLSENALKLKKLGGRSFDSAQNLYLKKPSLLQQQQRASFDDHLLSGVSKKGDSFVFTSNWNKTGDLTTLREKYFADPKLSMFEQGPAFSNTARNVHLPKMRPFAEINPSLNFIPWQLSDRRGKNGASVLRDNVRGYDIDHPINLPSHLRGASNSSICGAFSKDGLYQMAKVNASREQSHFPFSLTDDLAGSKSSTVETPVNTICGADPRGQGEKTTFAPDGCTSRETKRVSNSLHLNEMKCSTAFPETQFSTLKKENFQTRAPSHFMENPVIVPQTPVNLSLKQRPRVVNENVDKSLLDLSLSSVHSSDPGMLDKVTAKSTGSLHQESLIQQKEQSSLLRTSDYAQGPSDLEQGTLLRGSFVSGAHLTPNLSSSSIEQIMTSDLLNSYKPSSDLSYLAEGDDANILDVIIEELKEQIFQLREEIRRDSILNTTGGPPSASKPPQSRLF